MGSARGRVDTHPTFRWLRRIGLTIAALVVAGLIVVGGLSGWYWLEERKRAARFVEQSRTHVGPLATDPGSPVRGKLIELLDTLPAIEQLDGDGLRFVAMPSFGTTEYAVALFRPGRAEEATGVLVTLPKAEGEPVSERRFIIPDRAYAALTNEIRELAEDWQGDAFPCVDGTPVAFELIKEGRITSGAGNCSHHHRHIALLVLDAVRRFAPGRDFATEYDWHRFEADAAEG